MPSWVYWCLGIHILWAGFITLHVRKLHKHWLKAYTKIPTEAKLKYPGFQRPEAGRVEL